MPLPVQTPCWSHYATWIQKPPWLRFFAWAPPFYSLHYSLFVTLSGRGLPLRESLPDFCFCRVSILLDSPSHPVIDYAQAPRKQPLTPLRDTSSETIRVKILYTGSFFSIGLVASFNHPGYFSLISWMVLSCSGITKCYCLSDSTMCISNVRASILLDMDCSTRLQ